jgi:uncharacterized repeat protein (TIGR03803 family)
MDKAGNLYGTTADFSMPGCSSGCGTVFKIDRFGTESVLYSFKGPPDGAGPGAVIMDRAGNLYGATGFGGSSDQGTVFKLDPSGTENVLYSFNGYPDGSRPAGGVIMDAAGNLYGTTVNGGSSHQGTVFKLDPSGTESVLHNFTGFPTDGSFPPSGLLIDATGNLYGTTELGGPSNFGTVFKLDHSGTESVLYSFGGRPDGSFPLAGLFMDKAANLYGTTLHGGFYDLGAVFKLDTSGTESVLHSFQGSPDGEQPDTDVIMDTVGNLYGTTELGGSSIPGACPFFTPLGEGCGTVFRLDPSGTESVLYGFQGTTDGAHPAGLLVDAAGSFYGTTSGSGVTGSPTALGTVFELTPHTFAALIDLVKQFVRDPGAQNVMMIELKMAEAGAEKGNQKAANRMLGVFIHQVSAVHSRRSLTSAHAATLVEVAEDLMT